MQAQSGGWFGYLNLDSPCSFTVSSAGHHLDSQSDQGIKPTFSPHTVSAAHIASLIHWMSFAQGAPLLHFWILYHIWIFCFVKPLRITKDYKNQMISACNDLYRYRISAAWNNKMKLVRFFFSLLEAQTEWRIFITFVNSWSASVQCNSPQRGSICKEDKAERMKRLHRSYYGVFPPLSRYAE